MAGENENQSEILNNSISILIEGEAERKKNYKISNVIICKLPESLRNLNPSAYTPRITSIGPLHREDKRLKPMEAHKVTCMYRLFGRGTKSTKETALDCQNEVFKLLTRAKACYARSFTGCTDSEFAEMMIVDGCFILELLYSSNYKIRGADPIFDNILVMHDVKHDLMLLENQLPFFILEKLFEITVKNIKTQISLTELVLHFFRNMNFLTKSKLTTEDKEVEHCHILGLLQSCYRYKSKKTAGPPTTISYSATEAAVAGIKFSPYTDESGVTSKAPRVKSGEKNRDETGDIFEAYRPYNNGVPFEAYWDKNANRDAFPLEVILKQSTHDSGFANLLSKETNFRIPPLCINDSTLSFLRNLIAYEQCDPYSRHYVTSFAVLMDKLIDTKDDVSLLVKSNVLQHDLGSNEEMANIFNNICRGVFLHHFHYNDELKQLDEYCKRLWPKFKRATRRLCISVYKSATWIAISLVAAFILFVLTLIQTIFAYYSVKNA